MSIPGPIIYGLYRCYTTNGGVRLNFTPEKANLSIVIGTFSFTMLGFMATIITLLTILESKLHFKKYKKNGYLETFFFFYFYAIVNLFATFMLSVLNFAKQKPAFIFDTMFMLCINSLFQTLSIGIIIFNLLKHSYKQSD